jgi:acyl carrier protein
MDLARVRGVFHDSLNMEPPSDDADLIEGGFLDSLALVELVFALEREFHVDLSFEDLEVDRFRTVASIGELVHSRNGGSP